MDMLSTFACVSRRNRIRSIHSKLFVVLAFAFVIPADSSAQTAQSDDERKTLVALLDAVSPSVEKERSLVALEQAATWYQRAAAVKQLVLLDVSINPESRVKLKARMQRIAVQAGKRHYFLMQVENLAGITAPLKIEALDLAQSQLAPADWCTAKVVDHPLAPVEFSGSENEFRLLEVTVQKPGLWEVRFVGEAGQGTQDLGFRATADVLIDSLTEVANKAEPE